MIGSTNAYKDYFDEEIDIDEDEFLYRKRKTKKIIITIVIITILIIFVIFSIVSCTIGVKNNPYIQYDLTERNNFDRDYNNTNVIEEYYP